MTKAEYLKLITDPYYVELVRTKALELETDGCTGVTQAYLWSCHEHDVHYRTHRDVHGNPITKEQADTRKKWYIQRQSKFGRFSPMAQWRYWFLWGFAQRAWDKCQPVSQCSATAMVVDSIKGK